MHHSAGHHFLRVSAMLLVGHAKKSQSQFMQCPFTLNLVWRKKPPSATHNIHTTHTHTGKKKKKRKKKFFKLDKNAIPSWNEVVKIDKKKMEDEEYTLVASI